MSTGFTRNIRFCSEMGKQTDFNLNFMGRPGVPIIISSKLFRWLRRLQAALPTVSGAGGVLGCPHGCGMPASLNDLWVTRLPTPAGAFGTELCDMREAAESEWHCHERL